jgi:hypothetical protein
MGQNKKNKKYYYRSVSKKHGLSRMNKHLAKPRSKNASSLYFDAVGALRV